MTHQLRFSEITDQRTLTESANTTTDDTPETPTALLDRAQQHAMNVAAEHFPNLPIETIDWEVSHRVQRKAGVTKYDHSWRVGCVSSGGSALIAPEKFRDYGWYLAK
ncbi:hypothetical protein [Haladaptatus caseinilyticus]|uniref:hypothetical protein n=1 Tax=Haladaptatus caseinilyticus TaxID=2993314 RepID=UPI00224AC252|nr:hypothetical protein [Haladaptatus caseinilyticus]